MYNYPHSSFQFSSTPNPCKTCAYNNDCNHDCERYDKWVDLHTKEIELFFSHQKEV